MTGACSRCIRRGRLLTELGVALDFASRRRERLTAVLALDDAALIDALGGRRRAELQAWGERTEAGEPAEPQEGFALCRHDRRFPRRLRDASSPAMLTVLGGSGRLGELLSRPTVSILDSPEASEYGLATAGSLARSLCAAGVTVVAGVSGPLARAAHDGAAQAGGSLAVFGNGLALRPAGRDARIRSRVLEAGCAVSELPWGSAGRCWGPIAAERITVALADAVLVVESVDSERGLWAAKHARSLGRPLGAIPGMVTNALAAGPHALLSDGARLLRGAADTLELLHDAGVSEDLRAAPVQIPALGRAARRVLERIGAGVDTTERLSAGGPEDPEEDAWAVLAALGELESLGLVCRSQQGRYVRRDPPP